MQSRCWCHDIIIRVNIDDLTIGRQIHHAYLCILFATRIPEWARNNIGGQRTNDFIYVLTARINK
jgi:hypothetical protein